MVTCHLLLNTNIQFFVRWIWINSDIIVFLRTNRVLENRSYGSLLQFLAELGPATVNWTVS